jgi:exodeoxyribonuclease-5
LELTNEQQSIHDCVIDNIKTTNPLFTTGGFAGTGKTYLISEVRKTLEKNNPKLRIAFTTYTGKASSVLKKKLENIDKTKHFIGTIHSLIYRPEFHFNKQLNKMVITKWTKIEDLEYDLIVIDEASMVSEEILKDLQSFEIPIWAVGDHGQLPPVSDSPFCLMKEPDYKLETIHRQAEGNSIIGLSERARKQGSIQFGIYSSGVAKLPRRNKQTIQLFNDINWGDDVVVICGLNRTRVELNNRIRKNLKFNKPEPYVGERIICLRNNHESGIMNGELGTLLMLTYETPEILEICAQLDGVDGLYNGLCYYPIFGVEQYSDVFTDLKERGKDFKKILKNTNFRHVDFYDFGYAISCHKAQGSQWKRVVVFEERSYYWDDEYYSKWLYTAITRAEEKLILISYD